MLATKKRSIPGNSSDLQKKPFLQKTQEDSFFSGSKESVQPKLFLGEPNDKYEIEADAVADQVTDQSPNGKQLGLNPVFGQINPNNIQNSFFQPRERMYISTEGATALRSPIKSANQKQSILQPALGAADPQTESSNDERLQREEAEGVLPNLTQPSKEFEGRLNASKGEGSPLPTGTRKEMEGGIGADFSSVKVHTGGSAIQLSANIGAKAFTHNNDIYFNNNQYDPKSKEGKHLLAHELTHTVQQGASVKSKAEGVTSTKPNIQRGLLDNIGSFFSSIRNRVVNFIQSIPGYFLFTVLLGRDPLTDVRVMFSGHNLIKGFLLLLPNGREKYNKLVEDGAIERSATWIDQQLAEIGAIREQLSQTLERAKNSISAGDILDVSGALERIRGYFNPVISRVTNYARRVVTQVLQFLKDAVLNSLVNFIKERTRAYPLLRVLLGRDPITDEEVPRTMEAVIEAFLMLSESGEAMYNKMVESGALARATAWMRAQIATLPTLEQVVQAFTEAWQSISFEDLFQPVAAFQRIYGILNDPIGRIVRFVENVAIQILIFIKDAMLGWLKSNANSIPGYHLLTVLIGKDVFTQELVPPTFTNIIRGFMGLIPGGEEQFQQMQQSGVLPRLQQKINSAIESLGITWDFIVNLFTSIWESMTITDLLLPLVAFARIIARFREPISRLFAFIRVVIMAVVEVMLRMMNFPIDLIGQIINNAMQAYEDIKRDPIGFLKNLMRAAKKGFEQFLNNFVQHLIGGVTGWLFSELEEAGIQAPPDITFRSILGMTLEVLGITIDNIFARLAEKIGQERVARIRSAIDTLTGIWTFVRDVMDRGAVAIWERIHSQLSNLWDIIVDGIRNWIVTRIITAVTTKLLSMLDPTGIMPVINGFIAFFRAVQSFIEKLTQILQVVNQFVMGVGQIAQGNIQQAADFLEGALSRAMPVAVGFLANQVGLRGLGRRIGEMIGRAREAVNSAIDWLIDRALQMGQAILNRLTGRGNQEAETGDQLSGDAASLNNLNETFSDRTSDEHTLRFRGTSSPQLMVESDSQELGDFIREKKESLAADDPQQASLDQAQAKYNELSPMLSQIVSLDPESQQEEHSQAYELIQEKYNEIKALLPSVEVDDIIFPPMQLPAFSNNLAGSFGAEYIRKETVQGAPTSSNAGQNNGRTLEGWDELDKSGLRQSETWVKMHLLYHRFKGSHLDSNLTPARTGLNNPTFSNLEHDAHNFVENNPNEAIWYNVSISYQNVDIPTSIRPLTRTHRTSAKYLSSLNASWGKYEHSNLNKISHPGASHDSLNVPGINPPTFTGSAPSTKVLTGAQFTVFKSETGLSSNINLGEALGVSDVSIGNWLRDGVPNNRRSILESRFPNEFNTAINS